MINDVDNAVAMILINMIVTIPPTIMAFAALKQAQKVGKQVGEVTDEQGSVAGNLAEAAISQDSSLKLLGAILSRIDSRLETLETTQKRSIRWHDSHEEWHAAGMPERRKSE